MITAYAEQRDLLRLMMGPHDWLPDRQREGAPAVPALPGEAAAEGAVAPVATPAQESSLPGGGRRRRRRAWERRRERLRQQQEPQDAERGEDGIRPPSVNGEVVPGG